MHIESEGVERLLSGEFSSHERLALRDHLAACPECAEALEAARREHEEIGSLLSSLDHAVPDLDPAELARRYRRRAPSPRLAAAGIALLIVAGSAVAVPGSPVRSWLRGLLEGGVETTLPEDGPAGQSQRPPAGVSVVPTSRFEIVFESAQESGVIGIRIGDQAEVVVRSDGVGVGYSVEPLAVRVLNAGSSADHEIVLPRDAASIIIRVGDRIIYEMRDGRVVTPASGVVTGSYIVDLGALGRGGG